MHANCDSEKDRNFTHCTKKFIGNLLSLNIFLLEENKCHSFLALITFFMLNAGHYIILIHVQQFLISVAHYNKFAGD
jgi:hypothetical protein